MRESKRILLIGSSMCTSFSMRHASISSLWLAFTASSWTTDGTFFMSTRSSLRHGGCRALQIYQSELESPSFQLMNVSPAPLYVKRPTRAGQ